MEEDIKVTLTPEEVKVILNGLGWARSESCEPDVDASISVAKKLGVTEASDEHDLLNPKFS